MKMMTLEQIASACPDLKWKIERAKLFQYWGQYLKGEISGPDSDIGTRNLFVTGFKDETAQTLRTGEPSLMALRDHILATDAPTKTETPWLKLAKFGSKRTENNCLRHDANVIEISGVECDYDDEMISFDDAVEIMRKANVRCLLYTSASHTPEAPRWRVLVPFSKDYPPASRAPMVGRINGLFNGSLAPESFVLSTSYHYGSVANNPHHQAVVLDGGFLDLNDRLHAGSIDKQGHRVGHKDFEQSKSASERTREPGNPFSAINANPADKNEIIAALAVIGTDCGWVLWYKLASAIWYELRDEGEEIFHDFSARSAKYNKKECDKKWSEAVGNTLHAAGTIFYHANLANPEWRDQFNEADASRDDAGDTQESKSTAKPKIEVRDGELSELATLGEKLLIDAGVALYQRGGMLVRPIIEIVDASHGRKTKVAQLKSVDAIYVRDLLSRHGEWLKRDTRRKNKPVPTNPPSEIPLTMLGRVGEWKYPKRAGVISTPTMRLDGSILDRPGYDEETRLLLIEPPPMPAIPEKPTRDEAMAALMLIDDLLVEFPFVDDGIAKAVALAAIITPIVRAAFTVSPMFLSNAPVAGSGKSFLWDTVSAIAIGQLMPVMAAGRTEEETEKRLGAALLAGRPLISIDNISGELSGDALCAMIERPSVAVRVLGKSEDKFIESRGTTFYGSGNNLIVRGDLCRRALMTTLDPRLERPELRQFDHDPVARVLDNRGLYIAAALTICKAYIVAGRPNRPPRLASFEDWSDTVRAPLMWLGQADCVLSIELTRQDDPDRTELNNMLVAWIDAVGTGTRTTLAKIMVMSGEQEFGEPRYPELCAALAAAAFTVTNQRGKQVDAEILGKWLRRFKGRVVDGRRFENRSNPKGGSMWWVEQIAQHRPAAETEDGAESQDHGNEPRF
jgi:Primase C terminal 2 (PriCT-2)